MTVLDSLRGGLVVSCQPVSGGPMDQPEIVAAMAAAAVKGGAAAVRIEGLPNLEATRTAVSVPIIGILKRDLANSPIRITPFVEDVLALARAGADVIAYDATERPRPATTAELVNAIHDAGALAMADCSKLSDGRRALLEGADILGTTLSGYTEQTLSRCTDVDLDLIRAFWELGGFVMAEGRVNSPSRVTAAMLAGAHSVTVGTALTRLEHMTSWFVAAIEDV